MRYKKSIFGFYLLCCSFFAVFAEDNFSKIEKEMQAEPPGIGHTSDTSSIYSKVSDNALNKAKDNNPLISEQNIIPVKHEAQEFDPYLKLNKEGILVYIFSRKNSEFATFKATTHIKTSLDSILAVMLDNKSCIEWIDACENSFLIKKINFNERYHYQIFDIPFPFVNRDFIFHSTMKYNPENKTVTIQMSSEPDYCKHKQSETCKKINQSTLVRVKKSIGTFKLQPADGGIKITWTQHTDPAGSLPAWLVNYFVKNTPYWTFKNLAQIVKEEKYKYAKLIYNDEGMAIALNTPVIKAKEPQKTEDKVVLYPSF